MVREKLIGALEAAHNAVPREFIDDETKTVRDCIAAEADHLLANGVTLQKWIPVTERLPEDTSRVLVFLKPAPSQYTRMDTDRIVNGRWVRWSNLITHWMPLPQPPKEGAE